MWCSYYLQCLAMSIAVFPFVLLSEFGVSTNVQNHFLSESTTACPPWLDHGNDSCYCKQSENVRCESNNDIAVTVGSCVTWEDLINRTVMTDCPYITEDLSLVCSDLYYIVPASVSASNITSYVCSQFNRMGTHCGECLPGYGPAPFLNGANIACAKCHHHNYLWLLILLLQLFMVTVLFFIFVFFEIRGTSSPHSVFAYSYQVIVNSITSNAWFYAVIRCGMKDYAILQAVLNMCAFWNLDFFHFSLPAVCVSPSLTNAQALLFDYLVAFLPVVLTVISYILITLHDSGVWLIVGVWKPFKILTLRYKKNWNPKQSILSTFATFLLFSYSKLLFTSVNLLYGVPVYDNSGKFVKDSPVLYYDSTVKYFGLRHLPYVCLSMLTIITFVIIPPLFLILYPTRCFKRLLERCGFKRWHSLSIIMDVFQGWYKDGTNGTRDFRALSALYMILRILFASKFILVFMFQYRTKYNSFEWTLPSLVHLALGCFFLIAKPYKKNWMNIVDGLQLIVMGGGIVYMIVDYAFFLSMLMALFPLLIASSYAMYKCVVKVKLISLFKKSVKVCARSRKNHAPTMREASFEDDDLIRRRLVESDQVHHLQPSLSFRVNEKGNCRQIDFASGYGSTN